MDVRVCASPGIDKKVAEVAANTPLASKKSKKGYTSFLNFL